MDDISKPSVDELIRLAFNDANTTLANTIEAIENAPSSKLEKKDINKMVEEAVTKGTAIVRNEMQTMETHLTSQAKNKTLPRMQQTKQLEPSRKK